MEEYLATLKRRRYSVKSVQTYRYALRNFVSFFQPKAGPPPAEVVAKNVQDITAEDIEAYRLHLVERGLASASLEVFMRSVRLWFNWLEETGQLFLNPCRSMIVPKPGRKLFPVPTEEDIRKLLARPNVATPKGMRDRALIEVAYASGARREELVRMSIFDPDTKAQTVRIQGKGRKERVVPLGRHAVHWLKQYLDHARPQLLADKIDQEALWLGNSGAPQGGASMNLQVKTHARTAGTSVPVTLHALRRACATHMLQHGAHPVRQGRQTARRPCRQDRAPVSRILHRRRAYLVRDPGEKALFLDHAGHRLKHHTVARRLARYADRARLDVHVTPHTFRRSCTTELIRSGANLYHVKELLGHESLDTVRHYAKLTIADLKETHQKCHPRERENG